MRRYCHLKDIYVDKNGKAVAMEMVREACLWSTLTGGKPDSASPEWWKYKAQFLDECTSAKGTYTAECSERLAKGVTSGAQFEAWKKCYAPASTAGGTVKPADDEMAAMVDENEAWYDKLMVQINQKHYHGLFDTVRPPATAGGFACWARGWPGGERAYACRATCITRRAWR